MEPQKIHFVAVGGTAMAPLAVLLARRGNRVTGSDGPLYPPMSTLLAREGIPVAAGYAAANVPADCEVAVIGNAVPRTNPEVAEIERRGLPFLSLPEAVRRYLLPGKHPVVIAGTHGKTTTSALTAWILSSAGRDPGFLIGGEPINFGAGFRDGAGPHFVLEGDEYNAAFFDRGPKFLHYEPRTLLLNNVEFDHADLYPDLPSLLAAFRRLVAIVPAEGVIVANRDDPRVAELVAGARARVVGVSLSVGAECSASEVSCGPEGLAFTLEENGAAVARIAAPLWGSHNLRNVLAAAAAARSLGLAPEEVAAALARFAGVKRRLEVLGERGGALYVDDFAHHPTAVRETILAARQRWPGRRLWAVFEPRSITAGRRMFQDDYVRALAGADAAVIAPVFHAARFSPEELIDRSEIVSRLAAAGLAAEAPESVSDIEPLLSWRTRPGDVVLLMSSGDFAGLRQRAS